MTTPTRQGRSFPWPVSTSRTNCIRESTVCNRLKLPARTENFSLRSGILGPVFRCYAISLPRSSPAPGAPVIVRMSSLLADIISVGFQIHPLDPELTEFSSFPGGVYTPRVQGGYRGMVMIVGLTPMSSVELLRLTRTSHISGIFEEY